MLIEPILTTKFECSDDKSINSLCKEFKSYMSNLGSSRVSNCMSSLKLKGSIDLAQISSVVFLAFEILNYNNIECLCIS